MKPLQEVQVAVKMEVLKGVDLNTEVSDEVITFNT